MTGLLWLWLGLACTGQPDAPPVDSTAQLPWSIALQPDGSTVVLGLSPGHSTLAAARARFPGAPPDVAMFEEAGGALSLEAYLSEVSLGPLTGRVLLRLAAPPDLLAELQQRSKRTPLGTGTFRYEVPWGEDARLDALVVEGLTFAPAARLDEETLVARFGPPAERHTVEEGGVVLLYPTRGAALVVNPGGREQLHYVDPAAMGALRARLGLAVGSGEGGGGAGVHEPEAAPP